MTEQEAKVLVARLTRVWEPLEAQLPVNTPDEWLFYAVIRERVVGTINLQDVTLETNQTGNFYLHFFSEKAVEWEVGSLHARSDGVIIARPVYEQDRELATEFAAEWLPFFRRNCWLSGCPIEASTHEKAEWIQGLTAEELEAWNLKL